MIYPCSEALVMGYTALWKVLCKFGTKKYPQQIIMRTIICVMLASERCYVAVWYVGVLMYFEQGV